MDSHKRGSDVGGYDVLSAIGLSPGGDTIYTGSLEGTMYVTFDGGASWNEIFLPEQEMVRDIVVNPYDAKEIYVMIGQKYWYLNRIYHSTDAGLTRDDISTGRLPDISSFWSLAVDFSETPHKIFAGLNDGLYYSDDGGLTFKKVSTIPSTAVFDIDMDTLNDVAFVATNGRCSMVRGPGKGKSARIPAPSIAWHPMEYTCWKRPPYSMLREGKYSTDGGWSGFPETEYTS